MLEHIGDRVRIVGGELRPEQAIGVEQPTHARQVRDVGIGLAREHGIARPATLLGTLDFRVPVRALDEPHRNPAPRSRGQRLQPVEHQHRAPLVGLDRDTESVPVPEAGIAEHRFEQQERQFQAIGFFRVDRQTDPLVPSDAGEL